MCLSTVYTTEDGQRVTAAKQIIGISVDGSAVTLTDLMGRETIVSGRIAKIDLVNGSVFIVPE